MALKCPKTTDPNWGYAFEQLGNNYDELLYLYYKLGDRIPSKAEVDAYNNGYSLTAVNNQRSWNVENSTEDILRNGDHWTTLPDGRRQKLFKRHTEPAADKLIKKLASEYEDTDRTFFKVSVKYIDKGKVLNRWEIRVKDDLFRHAENDSIFHEAAVEIRNTMENMVGSQQSMDEGQYEVVDGEIIPKVEKVFTEETPVVEQVEKSITKFNTFNRQQVTDMILSEYDVEIQTTMRPEFNSMSKEEFNNMVESAGFNSLGSYWTTQTVYSAVENNVSELPAGVTFIGTQKYEDETLPGIDLYNVTVKGNVATFGVSEGSNNAAVEAEMNKTLSNFGAKSPDVDTNDETDVLLEARINFLKSKLPIDTVIIMDSEIPGIAQLDGKTPQGKAVIRLNPKKLLEDTLGHEFGHILIDLLGGMSNPMIRVGRQQLVGSDLEAQVMAAYPDQVQTEDERIDKEILATAVGMETAKLFAEEDKRTKFEKWLVRFFRVVRSKVGIEISVARELAERLVYDDMAISPQEVQGELSEYAQESRDLNNEAQEQKSILARLIDKEEELRKQALHSLEQKIGIYQSRGRDLDAIKDLKEALKYVENGNPTQGILEFVRSALDQTYKVKARLLRAKRKDRAGEEKIEPKDLDTWRTYVSAYDMLESYRQALVEAREDMSIFGTEEDQKAFEMLLQQNALSFSLLKKQFGELYTSAAKDVNYKKGSTTIIDQVLPVLDKIIETKNEVKNYYKVKGKELMVDFLAPHVTVVQMEMKEAEEKKWRAIPYEQRQGQDFDMIWLAKLEDLREEITEKTRERLSKELDLATDDIGFLSRHLDTMLDSPDMVASVIAKIYVTEMEKTRRNIIEERYTFIEMTEALEKQQGRDFTTADETLFDFMLEEDENMPGKIYSQYLISNVPSLLKKDYYDMIEALETSGVDNSTGKKLSKYEKWLHKEEWRKKWAPRNEEAWLIAQDEFIDSLRERKLVTTKQATEFKQNIRKKYKLQKTNAELFGEDSTASMEIEYFNRSNFWNYRELSSYYKKLNKKWDTFEKMREVGMINGKQTDQRVIFYDFILEKSKQADDLLPGKYRLGNKLPGVVKSMGDRMRANEGVWKTIKRESIDKFQKRGSDIEKGTISEQGKLELVNEANEPVYLLPIHYTNKVDLNDQSFDVATIYFNYLRMSLEYDTLRDLQAPFEMAGNFIKERKYTKTNDMGQKVKNALSRGKTEDDAKFLDKPGSEAHTTAQFVDFMKMNLYGMRKAEEQDWHILGLKIDQAKFLDGINQYTGLSLLGFNVIQGFANVALGETMQTIEARAAEFFGMKNLHNATMMYYANLGGTMADIGKRKPSNIISLLNDAFDTLGDYTGGKINKNSRFRELFETSTAFFLSHAGEHYMQTRAILAMLDRMVALDSDGKELGSMLKQFTVENGRLKLNEKVANFNADQQAVFKGKTKRILARMHGEYSREGMSAIQMYSFGRMAIMFRKFIVPGAKRRWQGKRYNELLGEYTEGNYVTFGRVLPQLMKDLIKLKFEILSKNKSQLTKAELANVIRTLNEIAALASVIILGMLATRAMDDDDDDKWWLNHLAYQALRVRSELAFFIMPTEAMKILRSPAAGMAVFENVIKLIGDLSHPLLSGTFEFDTYQQGPWKEHYKIEKTLVQGSIGLKQFYRIRDIKDQISWFK